MELDRADGAVLLEVGNGIAQVAWFKVCTTACGVPRGATMPHQASATLSMPVDSLMVGRSGAEQE